MWKPPFRDAADVVIEKILDRNTIEPINGFTDEQLLALVNKQNEIMDTHEDYAALRGITKVTDKMQTKVQIAKGMKGITKLLTTEKFRYPAYGALMLSKDFIPPSVFSNTDIVEYREGRVRHITGSKIPNIGIDSDRSKEESGKVQPVGRLIKSESTAADKICRTALDCD